MSVIRDAMVPEPTTLSDKASAQDAGRCFADTPDMRAVFVSSDDGTLVGVILIVLLNSVLSIMEMPEAGRQVIYGGVIILMLLVYGRGERVTS